LQKFILRDRAPFKTSIRNVAFLYKRLVLFYRRIKIAILVDGNEIRQFCEPLYFKDTCKSLCGSVV